MADTSTPSPPAARPAKPKRSVKVTPAAKRSAVLDELAKSAHQNGYKGLKVASLLGYFGYQKRSEANLRLITETLAARNLTVYPALSMSLKLSQSVRLYCFPVECLGDLFDEGEAAPTSARKQLERGLESYIEQQNLFGKLGLSKPQRQFSPAFTHDRFDYLCQDGQGNPVVLELKHAGGGKSAVEQVLRYIGMLKQANRDCCARGILVTGIRDVDTAKALHGMTKAQQAELQWYLYRFDKNTGALDFELVSYDFIEEQLCQDRQPSIVIG
ncbi:endonuclease NucS domain-containing protein [Hymenobacter sp. 102]|uniref:endonuclease NucS domain-containing protein n=1 Tax=Hymenobacter sp. 102 TaxID=3403152 RepID=UPI003CFB34B5